MCYSDYKQLNGLLTENVELKQDVIIPGGFHFYKVYITFIFISFLVVTYHSAATMTFIVKTRISREKRRKKL